MSTFIPLVEHYGLWIVFIAVLLDQGGLPTPSYAPIIVTAGMATDSGRPVWPVALAATAAALIADAAWFAGGRRYGSQLLRMMCRLSLSPDSCVRSTRQVYERWGAPSLILAKYIPGFAAVSTTLAGQAGTSWGRFLAFDSIGALLWSLGAVALGSTFHEVVEALLMALDELGHIALLVLVIAIASYLSIKFWQRRRFQREILMTRISTEELRAEQRRMPVVLLDVRSADSRLRDGWIPGSVHVCDIGLFDAPLEREIVVYCDCPNDASAAMVARRLRARGYVHVRPLEGGIAAWRSRGLPLDGLALAAHGQ